MRFNRCIIAFGIIMVMLFGSSVFAQSIDVKAKSAILIDASTGYVIFDKNAHEKVAPASITKMMTLKLALEAIRDGKISKDDMVTVSKRAWEVGGSTMFLNVGDKVKVGDLLQGIAVASGNDACIAIAEHMSGSVDEFAQRMNQRAQSLGLKETHYENPHGLDAPNHYMSAHDIAMLARDSINSIPEILQYHSQPSFTYNGITQQNRNPLLGNYPGADGLKTGMTDNAGYSLAGTAKQGDTRLIGVVMGEANEEIRQEDMIKLLNHGFKNYETATVLQQSQPVGNQVPVRRGVSNTLEAVTASPLVATIPKGELAKVEQKAETVPDLTAPIAKGQKVGRVVAMYQGKEIGAVDLVAAKDVGKAGFLKSLWQSIIDFFRGLVRFRS
ncbi:MAG: D-alanyl-D-alanine carboxypeptidase family protein [Bacillota bacterium]